MNTRKKAVFSWSGGKDSALALHQIVQQHEFEVVALLTTIDAVSETSSIHSVPLNLLEKQAESMGIPLYPVRLSAQKNYEEAMREAAAHFKVQDVDHFIFGDIFLEDVRAYREKLLQPLGIHLVMPLWGKTSVQVLDLFIASGIRTKIIVTQADQLDKEFIGRELDENFAASLPKTVDACGENGEYHTFAYAGGPFGKPVLFEITEVGKISHSFTMDTGETKTFHYWKAELE